MNTEEELMQSINNCVKFVLNFTPIISLPIPPSAIHLGCGIYLKIKNDYYLISAGHLLNLENFSKLITSSNEEEMIFLSGRLLTTYENEKTDNSIDFGILKFFSSQIPYLEKVNYSFINSQNIIVNHKVEENGMYLIAGYPNTGVKTVTGKREFKINPIVFITSTIDREKYISNKFNPDHFILLKYKRKIAPNNSTEKQITKELKGISGSGLWYIPNYKDLENGIPKCFLVGIMTENIKRKGFLVALRIDFITETINQVFEKNTFEKTKFNFENFNQIFASE